MRLYPAIDLHAGRCVRLLQGRFDSVTEYAEDPVAMAVELVRRGAPRLHVVDLDGAREGRPVQLELVRRLCAAAGVPVQLGGGLRTEADVAAALDAGAARVVLGSALAKAPGLGRRLAERHGASVGAAVDALGGRVRVSGWQEDGAQDAGELIARLLDEGIKAFLCTEISRDGMLGGPALEWYGRLRAAHPDAELLASGGVGSIHDLLALRELGMDGAVLGKALYEGRVELEAALLAVEAPR
jgi:phosphoribosylformimino-5-aminoimidazole carboxamide ribotide isomerase